MPLFEEEAIKVEVEASIAKLTLNRPQNLNALNVDLLQAIILTFERLHKDGALRVITITGAGDKAFVAGADIKSMAQLGPRAIADYVELGQRAMRCIECHPTPVVAAVNGYALGGGLELALACDIIVASRNAKLGQPEVNLGIIPGFGGTQRLLKRCGIGTVRRLIYTGDIIGAEEALQVGLVDKVVDEGELDGAVKTLAQGIVKKAPLAVMEAKRVIGKAEETAFLGGLRTEIESFLKLFSTGDREEGMQAFMQKREPVFRGK